MNACLSSVLPSMTSAYKQTDSTTPVDQVIERNVIELLPHPGFTKHAAAYSTQEVSLLSDRGETAYLTPLTITQDSYIVDGYPMWLLATMQGRATLPCIVRHMSHEEALLCLIENNRGSKGLNDFIRILMALELEPWFKMRAKSNQQLGGRQKGSSRLTEADKLDVRVEIARAAGVSVGNVSKVKQLVVRGVPELHDAVRRGEIRIHRASEWAKTSAESQRHRLSNHRNECGIRRTIRRLLMKHKSRQPKICDGLHDIQKGLKKLQTDERLSLSFELLGRLLREIDSLLIEAEGLNRAS